MSEAKIKPGDENAFPITCGVDGYYIGMSLREYAAIHLGVPDSGQEWLDDMIRESNINKNDLAEHIAKIIGHDISCMG